MAGVDAVTGGPDHQLDLLARRQPDPDDRRSPGRRLVQRLRRIAGTRRAADCGARGADRRVPGRGISAGAVAGGRPGPRRRLAVQPGLCHQHRRRGLRIAGRRLLVHPQVRPATHTVDRKRLPGPCRPHRRRPCREILDAAPGRWSHGGGDDDPDRGQPCLGSRAVGQRRLHVCAVCAARPRSGNAIEGGHAALLPRGGLGHSVGEEIDRHHDAGGRWQDGRLQPRRHAHPEAGGAPAAAPARQPERGRHHRPRQRRHPWRRTVASNHAGRRARDLSGSGGGLGLLQGREQERAGGSANAPDRG